MRTLVIAGVTPALVSSAAYTAIIPRIIRLTSLPDAPEAQRLALIASKHLRRGGVAGVIFASILGLAITSKDAQVGAWWEKASAMGKTLLESAAEGAIGGVSETATDDTVSCLFVKNPDSFVNGFLNLKPEQSKFYLSQSPELRNLMIGYADLVKVLDTEEGIDNCYSTTEIYDGKSARGTVRATIHQQRGTQ